MNINTVCLGLPLWLSGKEPACNAGAAGSIPWKKARLPTRLPSILAQKIPWMRTLEDDSPWVVKTQTRLCMCTVAAGEIDCKCRRRAAGLPYTSGLSM